jgi:hypothetical protein
LKFSLSPFDEHKSPRINELMSIISAPGLAKDIKQHMSSYGAYEDHNFIDESSFTEEQDFLLNQLEVFHDLQDPVAIWMDSLLTQVPNVATLGISLTCSSKCKFFLEILMKIFHSFCIFSKSFLQKVIFISQMLLWIHWKSDYT